MKLRLPALAAVLAALLTLALGAGTAQADPAETYSTEIAFSLTSPCAPYEVINVTGTLRGVVRQDGGHYTAHETMRLKGESVSGVRYVATDVENTSVQVLNRQGTAATDTDVQATSWIAQGESAKGDDFLAHHVIHTTRNPDGEVIVVVFNERLECK